MQVVGIVLYIAGWSEVAILSSLPVKVSLLLLFACVCLWLFGRAPLSIMEADDLASAMQAPSVFAAFLQPPQRAAVHQPMNIGVLKVVESIWDDPQVGVIRIFYLVVGAVAVLLFFDIAGRLLARPYAIVASLVMALHPLVLEHSVRAMSYILLVVFECLHLRFLFAYLSERRVRHLVAASLMLLLMFHCQYMAIFLALAEAVFFFGRREFRELKMLALVFFVPAAAWVAYSILGFNLLDKAASYARHLTYYLPVTALPLVMERTTAVATAMPHGLIGGLFICLLGYLVGRRLKEAESQFLLVSLGFLAIHAVHDFSQMFHMKWAVLMVRHLTLWVPLVALAVGEAFSELAAWLGTRVTSKAIVVYLTLFVSSTWLHASRNTFPDYKELEGFMVEHMTAGDGVFFPIEFTADPLGYEIFDVPLPRMNKLSRGNWLSPVDLRGKHLYLIGLCAPARSGRDDEDEFTAFWLKKRVWEVYRDYGIDRVWFLFPIEKLWGVDHVAYDTWWSRVSRLFYGQVWEGDGWRALSVNLDENLTVLRDLQPRMYFEGEL